MTDRKSDPDPVNSEPLTASAAFVALSEAFRRTGPEAAEHLAVAGREVAEAVRSFVRGFAEALTEKSQANQDDLSDGDGL